MVNRVCRIPRHLRTTGSNAFSTRAAPEADRDLCCHAKANERRCQKIGSSADCLWGWRREDDLSLRQRNALLLPCVLQARQFVSRGRPPRSYGASGAVASSSLPSWLPSWVAPEWLRRSPPWKASHPLQDSAVWREHTCRFRRTICVRAVGSQPCRHSQNSLRSGQMRASWESSLPDLGRPRRELAGLLRRTACSLPIVWRRAWQEPRRKSTPGPPGRVR